MSPKPPRTPLASEQGFTLVEFMIAALIMSFVLGGSVLLATQLQRSYSTQLEDAGLEQEVRYALDWIARDLRQAGSDPYYSFEADEELFIDPNGGGDPNDSIRIQQDVNSPGADGDIDDAGEDITIAYDPGDDVITRTDTNAGTAEDMTDPIITDLSFTFLDASHATTTVPEDVVFVRVEITAQSRAWNSNLGERPTTTLATEVRVRTRD
jgi:prepilin-type N-terminal cleavage/methylation domain-containing protein